MAYTIKALPPFFSSVHDDLVYTVSYPEHFGDPVTYVNFRYVADVYVQGVLVATLKKFPNPATGIGIFNIGQVVRSYINTGLNPVGGLMIAQTISTGELYLQVDVKFGEEYSGTKYVNLLDSTTYYFFNSYDTRTSPQCIMNKLDSVASNRPYYGEVTSTSQWFFIPYLPQGLTGLSVPFVITPDVGTTYTSSFTPTGVAGTYVMEFLNVAPYTINAYSPGTITPSTTSYTVKIGVETYSFKVVCENVYKPFMVHFMNQYGGFDSKLFQKVSRRQYDINKTNYGKLSYNVDSAGIVTYKNANGVYNETTSVFNSQFNEKHTINTDFLTDQEYVWLKELLISPLVYAEENGVFYPVLLGQTNYVINKNINDDLTNLSIDLTYGITENAQVR